MTQSSFLYLLKYNLHLLGVPWLKTRVLLGGWVDILSTMFALAKKEKIKLLSKLDVALSVKQCIFTVKKLTMISIYSYLQSKNTIQTGPPHHSLQTPTPPPPPPTNTPPPPPPPPASSSPLRWSVLVFSIDKVMVLTWTEWNQKEHLAGFFSRIRVHAWLVNMTGKWIFLPVKSPL